LLGGADDAGSTIMEKNIISTSGTSKMDTSKIELQSSIKRAGFTPQRKNSDYDHLQTVINPEAEKTLVAPVPRQS